MELSGLIGYFMGFVLGNLILGSLLAGLVFLIAKIAGKSWNGWKAGMALGALGVMGQVVNPDIIGIAGSSLGFLGLWMLALNWDKQHASS